VNSGARAVTLRDSTLREGLDTPNVSFTVEQKLEIVAMLAKAGVPEAEVVAPSRVREDLVFAREMKRRAIPIAASGLIYANGSGCEDEIDQCSDCLSRVDLLMPLSEHRPPRARHEKIARLLTVFAHARSRSLEIGVGFPHATQVEPDFLVDIAKQAAAAGAKRVTVYDTNGGADPFRVHSLVQRLCRELSTPVFFHAHNDLGLATANSWAAVQAGAAGLDVTVNGLGDRAGNASLEQLVMLLHLNGVATGVRLSALKSASRLVEELSAVPLSKLAPIVGEYVFEHKSPSHLSVPTEFEAFDPGLIGERRRIVGS
jgi:homocitrate synthase NifV